MKYVFIYALLFPVLAFSQAQLVMNNDGYIVIGSNAYLVIGNSNANAITQTGTGGRIISEGEGNIVRWMVSNATGTYVIPFYDDGDAQEIPVTATITIGGTAGTGNRIDFSTYDGGWDNDTYRPSGVTNMGNATIPAANNSAKVVDRFWILDANHATRPSVTIGFTYIDNEWSAAGNSITEANLLAQRWNASLGDWDGFVYPPTGTISTAANTVTGIGAPAGDFFRSWTLVDNSTPLPIELVSNTTECIDHEVVIRWATASETNNDFFRLEKSTDGVNFNVIATIPGAGNSTSVINYSFTDHNTFSGTTYYRLSQTDYNGDSSTFPILTSENCATGGTEVNAFNDQAGNIAVTIYAPGNGDYVMTLYDALGKKLGSRKLFTEKGSNNFRYPISEMNAGIYYISIENSQEKITRKILVL